MLNLQYSSSINNIPVRILIGLLISLKRRDTQGWVPPPKIGRSVPISMWRSSKSQTTVRVKAWLEAWGSCSSIVGSGMTSLLIRDGCNGCEVIHVQYWWWWCERCAIMYWCFNTPSIPILFLYFIWRKLHYCYHLVKQRCINLYGCCWY